VPERASTDRPAADPALLDLALRLHSAMLHMMRLVRRADEASGLSAPRMSALSTVVFGGPRTLGEMAAMEQVSAPTMTRLVAGLERGGYVARRRDAIDRRVTWVRPTAKGKRVLEQGRSRRVRMLADAINGLPAADRAALDRASTVLIALCEAERKSYVAKKI